VRGSSNSQAVAPPQMDKLSSGGTCLKHFARHHLRVRRGAGRSKPPDERGGSMATGALLSVVIAAW
jgi:hypothetical protein